MRQKLQNHNTITHQSLIDAMEALGYYGNQNGICAGITRKWAEAILLGEENKFISRLQLITSLSPTELKKQVIASRDKVKTGDILILTPLEQQLLEIPAFFDGVLLYLQPQKFTEVFGENLLQGALVDISRFSSSEEIQKQGGLKVPLQQTLCLKKNALQHYLTDLSKALSQISDQDIPIILSSGRHQIGIRWDYKQKKWEMLDANQLPPQWIAPKEIGKAVILSLLKENPESDLNFHLKVIMTAEKTNNLSLTPLHQFKLNHPVSAAMTEKTSNDLYLVELACLHEDYVGLLQMAAARREVGKPLAPSRETPLIVQSALVGNRKLLDLFLNNGSRVDEDDKTGRTALMIAAQQGNLKLIEHLLNIYQVKNIDPNTPNSEGDTLTRKAVGFYLLANTAKERQKRMNELVILAQHGLDFFKPTPEKIVPIRMLLHSSQNWPIASIILSHLPDDKKFSGITEALKNYELNVAATALLLLPNDAKYDNWLKNLPAEMLQRISDYGVGLFKVMPAVQIDQTLAERNLLIDQTLAGKNLLGAAMLLNTQLTKAAELSAEAEKQDNTQIAANETIDKNTSIDQNKSAQTINTTTQFKTNMTSIKDETSKLEEDISPPNFKI